MKKTFAAMVAALMMVVLVASTAFGTEAHDPIGTAHNLAGEDRETP